jgi:hypothetical protein
MANFRLMRRSPGRRRAVIAVVALALLAGVVASSPPSPAVRATSIEAFERVFAANDNGSIATFGNNLMSCPDAAAGRAPSPPTTTLPSP